MKYSHESEELNALLGKKVKVTLFDGTAQNGSRGGTNAEITVFVKHTLRKLR